MPNNQIEIIPQSKVLELAGASVLRTSLAEIPGTANWRLGTINKTPLVIYDINGTPLFYDFFVKKGAAHLGTVRMAASKVLGSPAVSYELGERKWNYLNAVKKLKPEILKQYPGSRVLSTRLVCYSYPRIGVMFEILNNRQKISLIYDAADLSLVPQTPLKPGIEGNGIWSFYDSIPEQVKKQKINSFNQFEVSDKKVIEMVKKQNLTLTNIKKIPGIIDIQILKPKYNVTKEIPFCSHYNYNEARSHRSFVLHAQQKNDYCAVATCQMILCFYRHYYSQNQIAPSLGYAPGGCPSDQSPGYRSLSNNHIIATYDTSATWEEAKAQIDALHPMKSGIPGHARACAGYSYTKWIFPGLITNKKLLIYDPWPWNSDYKLGGSIYWEDWDSITHTNFVYTRLDY